MSGLEITVLFLVLKLMDKFSGDATRQLTDFKDCRRGI